ncbi:MAG TPA: hypothetical protein VG694_02480 [Candidatus Paceibacterota bacterium]|nr:hypothetical protein [Candidatus Paceibacterota bacterium]
MKTRKEILAILLATFITLSYLCLAGYKIVFKNSEIPLWAITAIAFGLFVPTILESIKKALEKCESRFLNNASIILAIIIFPSFCGYLKMAHSVNLLLSLFSSWALGAVIMLLHIRLVLRK